MNKVVIIEERGFVRARVVDDPVEGVTTVEFNSPDDKVILPRCPHALDALMRAEILLNSIPDDEDEFDEDDGFEEDDNFEEDIDEDEFEEDWEDEE